MPMIFNTSICISISILIYMYVGSCGHLSFFFSNIGCQKNISMGILGTEAASGCAETWRIVSRPVLLDSAWGLSASKWLRLRHLRKQRCSLGPRDTHGYLIIISIYIYIYNIYIYISLRIVGSYIIYLCVCLFIKRICIICMHILKHTMGVSKPPVAVTRKMPWTRSSLMMDPAGASRAPRAQKGQP